MIYKFFVECDEYKELITTFRSSFRDRRSIEALKVEVTTALPTYYVTHEPVAMVQSIAVVKMVNNVLVARFDKYPHMARIGYKDTEENVFFHCGASLISERFVLTVAHCRRTGDNQMTNLVRLGEDDDYDVKSFLSHSLYNRRMKQHDIALVELINDVKLVSNNLHHQQAINILF